MEVIVVVAVVVVIVAVVLLVAGRRREEAPITVFEPSVAEALPDAPSPAAAEPGATKPRPVEPGPVAEGAPGTGPASPGEVVAAEPPGPSLEERQAQQIADLETRCADLGRQVEEQQAELRRYRRWANAQLTRVSEEMAAVWQREKLPAHVHEMDKPPSEEVGEQLRRLAEPLLQWMEDLGLGEAEVYYRVGLWQALEGRHEEAVAAFHEAVGHGMGMDAWLGLGDSLWALDRRRKARDAYRPCKSQKRVPTHVLHRCAQVAFDERRYEEALADLEQVLSRKKPEIEVYALASLTSGKLGNHARAVAICEDGLNRHPDSPALLANMIIPLGHLGQAERAEEVYRHVRQLDPQLADAPFAMGVAKMHRGDHEAAMQLLAEAIALREIYPEAHFCMGVIRNRDGEYTKAIEHFKRAVALRPDYAEAYYNMKDSYDGLRDFESSIAMLEKAVALNPKYR